MQPKRKPKVSPPPHDFADPDWIDAETAAAHFKKCKRTILNWFRDGLFVELKMRTYRDPSGMVWIYYPRKPA